MMKRAAVILAYTLCTSCVLVAEDDFVTAGGLQEITTREQLFERDIRLSLASSGTPSINFDSLSPDVQSCLVGKAVATASPTLLAAADGFLGRKTEATWGTYRATRAAEENRADKEAETRRLTALTARCQAPTYFRIAAL